jgi:hypothetical protein
MSEHSPAQRLPPVLQLLRLKRRPAPTRFGEHNLAAGQPLSYLQEVLVPVYFHHRYAVPSSAERLFRFQ